MPTKSVKFLVNGQLKFKLLPAIVGLNSLRLPEKKKIYLIVFNFLRPTTLDDMMSLLIIVQGELASGAESAIPSGRLV